MLQNKQWIEQKLSKNTTSSSPLSSSATQLSAMLTSPPTDSSTVDVDENTRNLSVIKGDSDEDEDVEMEDNFS